ARVAVNPEFMREGSSLQDFAEPPFVIVGCGDPETAALVRSLYPGVQAPFVHTAVRTAEMVKYVSNAFHALKVCFANEIGDVCAASGADPHEVMRIFLADRKLNVSDAYLRPGFAFGGSCLPKDLRALVHAGREADLSLPLLSAILHIASLRCDSVDAVVQHADVLVIGSASDEARRAVAAARPDQVVVDLTRSAATPPGARRGSRAGAR